MASALHWGSSPQRPGQPGPEGVRCINEPGWSDRMKLVDSTRRWYWIGYKRTEVRKMLQRYMKHNPGADESWEQTEAWVKFSCKMWSQINDN